jgi:subtilisin-like proprotein convertase family protein
VWRVTDAALNSSWCTQVVAIVDTTAPTLGCPPAVAVQCDAEVPPANFAGGSVTDGCDPAPVVTHEGDVAVGTCPKTITRSYKATDACGNSETCTQTITVQDTTAPTLNCPPLVYVTTFSLTGAVANFTVSGSDNCDPAPVVVCTPESGSAFPVGTNRVDCLITDACGNTNGCAFPVVVSARLCESFAWAVDADIPDNDANGLADTRTVATAIGALDDVNVTLVVSNGWNGDLYAYLVHDSGFAVLLNRVGRTGADPLGYDDAGMAVTFDDQTTNDVHLYRLTLNGSHAVPLAGPLTNSWAPDARASDPATVLDTDSRTEFLSSFNGLNPNGPWTLFIADVSPVDTSHLVSWGLELCGSYGEPPYVATAPQSQTVPCGSNATFSVTAGGTEPLDYRWLFNGAPLSGATSPSLLLAPATFANAGTYAVVLSNAFGVLTSAPVTLTVVDTNLPVIATQPESRTNNVGTTAIFTVVVTSCSPLSYQWYFGAAPLTDETNAALTLASVQLTDAGSYRVDVSNAAGTVSSVTVTLTVNRPPLAADNGGATRAGRPLGIALDKLLANDSDADGDPLTVIGVTMSTNGGSVALTSTNVIYTPAPGFIGLDRYTYTISDGMGGLASADVIVFVASGDLPSLNGLMAIPQPGGVLIRFAGVPGRSYDLQRAPGVFGPWATLSTVVAPIHGIIEYLDLAPPSPSFYRTVAP